MSCMYVCTCVCVCVCVCVFLSVCIIIIINIIFFFFVFYKRPRNHFRDIVGSRDKKIEINQITKLTKREKIVSWSNRVYRSIEGDVLRSSITTGHETNPSFHSSPFNLTRTSNGDHRCLAISFSSQHLWNISGRSSLRQKRRKMKIEIIKVTINDTRIEIKKVEFVLLDRRKWMKRSISQKNRIQKNFRNLSNKLKQNW